MNIVVIHPTSYIGDTLFVFPTLAALRSKFTNAHITFVSYAPLLPLALAWEFADEVLDCKQKQWEEVSSPAGIRSSHLRDLLKKTDCVICFQVDFSGVISRNLREAGVNDVFVVPENPIEVGSKHVADFMTEAVGLQSLGIQHIVETYVPPGWYGSSGFCLYNPPIAFHPGSTAQNRRWPASSFAAVINQLLRLKYPVLLLAGPAEAETLQSVRRHISAQVQRGMLTILENASLLEVAQKLKQCRFFLGNDSGIGHLAGLLGVPMLMLFGPSDPTFKRPIGPYVETLREMPIENLSSERVIEHILRRL